MENVLLCLAVAAVLFIAVMMIAIALAIDRNAMKFSFWDDMTPRQKRGTGMFDEYISHEQTNNNFEFRLAGLLCDAGAPIVRNKTMIVCLPNRGEFLEMHAYDIRNGVAYIDKVEHVTVMKENAVFPKKKKIWSLSRHDKGDELFVQSEDVLLPCNISLKWRAGAAIYSVITGTVI